MKTTKPTAQALRAVALTGLLSLAFVIPANAVDFSGSLTGVTITDAKVTNSPPVATFTYKQDGETLLFDASGSSDPDGSITAYKWDFGSGSVAEGATSSYTPTSPANVQVTLTVVDNNNGVALSQRTVGLAPKGVQDDFSTDTAGNYTVLKGGLKVADGAMHSSGNWTTTYAIHTTELASDNHTVEADVFYSGSSGTSGLLFRFNKEQATGYSVWFASGRIMLNAYSSGSEKFISFYDGKYAAGIYRLKAEISGNLIKIYVNGTLVLEKTDSTYGTGKQIGLKINPYGDATSVTVDNLTGN
ncbi:PKD domain-containing protein [Desulfobulbus sp.]|uniref:PKD domain-containing protein n=1 Tax=Desulfobulbus sp. TaxID=895 RepID=UPI0027B9A2C4|nr:PKD domain-containing protein [Desulfobulbus sp.]